MRNAILGNDLKGSRVLNLAACRTGVIFTYFRRAEAKVRRARSTSCVRGEEREKIKWKFCFIHFVLLSH